METPRIKNSRFPGSIKTGLFVCIVGLWILRSAAQNALFIPPLLSGPVFNLSVQSGTQTFFTGYNTPTYGINGVWLGPTLLVNKGDSITLNVTNNLTTSTTMHWHGLHVAPENDGGPHQVIMPGTTWSPSFKVRNDAATFWYHPHGQGKTDLHVSKGLAGLILVKDPIEAGLVLPRTYGVDDIPLIVQSKAFDVLRQIAIATEEDTSIFVNGTLDPFVDLPAQVVRFRMLNGSSMRSFNFAFTGNMPFKLITGDGGLLDSAVTLTQKILAPGERIEILLDLAGLNGQTIFLRNLGSSMPNGIYGAAQVGSGTAVIPGYNANPRNGADYDVLKINVIAQTTSPVTTTPGNLTTNSIWPLSSAVAQRIIDFSPDTPGDSAKMVEGPFYMNGKTFDMDTINVKTQLNNVETWTLVNNTLVAHPFHMHDIQFYILDINGVAPPPAEKGKKDLVLVMPGDSVRFITKFEDFANDTLGYMYHCHLLHHEDDGMMGQFVVMNLPVGIGKNTEESQILLYPNPTTGKVNVIMYASEYAVSISNIIGQRVLDEVCHERKKEIDLTGLNKGIYILSVSEGGKITHKKLLIE